MGCASSTAPRGRTRSSLSSSAIEDADQTIHTLRVELYGAVVRARGRRQPNTYVVIRVAKHAAIDEDQVFTSSIATGTCTPSWQPYEAFTFSVLPGARSRARLVLSVYDRDAKHPAGDAMVRIVATMSEDMLVLPLIDTTGKQTQLSAHIRCRLWESDCVLYDTHLVWEYQRRSVTFGWGASFPQHLLPTDPEKFASYDLSRFAKSFAGVEPPLPEGWVATSVWSISAGAYDSEGWQYAYSFLSKIWRLKNDKHFVVRRRLWWREIINERASKRQLSHIQREGEPRPKQQKEEVEEEETEEAGEEERKQSSDIPHIAVLEGQSETIGASLVSADEETKGGKGDEGEEVVIKKQEALSAPTSGTTLEKWRWSFMLQRTKP